MIFNWIRNWPHEHGFQIINGVILPPFSTLGWNSRCENFNSIHLKEIYWRWKCWWWFDGSIFVLCRISSTRRIIYFKEDACGGYQKSWFHENGTQELCDGYLDGGGSISRFTFFFWFCPLKLCEMIDFDLCIFLPTVFNQHMDQIDTIIN